VFPRDGLSMSTRVAITVAAVLVLGVGALSSVAYWSVADRLSADLDRALLREAEAYSAALQQGGGAADVRTATRTYLLARSRSFSTVHPVLMVRFGDGRVLSNTDLQLEQAPGNVRALDTSTAARAFLDVTFEKVRYRAATVPVTSPEGTVIAVFEAALPTATTEDLRTQLLVTLIGVGMLVAVVGALLAVWAARGALRPLSRAAATASVITQSSLTERIVYDGPDDEVGGMVASINAMLGRLNDSFGEQRRFIADASHELRTPLAVVSGHLEMMRDMELTEEERREEISLISDEVGRMGRLVDDLLALARLDAGPPLVYQPLEIATLLQEVAARGRGLGDRRFSVDAAPGLWVLGDPDQLMQAFLNLAGNAVAHTATGGNIRLAASADRYSVRVAVEDSGSGVREEDLPRLFDRFFRAQGPRSRDGGGSGLGLAITRRLVELHGGRVEAANLAGGGAVFTVALPRAHAPD
jgi:two-component system, OmpR family, sensor kinase